MQVAHRACSVCGIIPRPVTPVSPDRRGLPEDTWPVSGRARALPPAPRSALRQTKWSQPLRERRLRLNPGPRGSTVGQGPRAEAVEVGEGVRPGVLGSGLVHRSGIWGASC